MEGLSTNSGVPVGVVEGSKKDVGVLKTKSVGVNVGKKNGVDVGTGVWVGKGV